MTQQIEIYVAAKKKHAEKLLQFFREADGVHLCSRWMETANMDINRSKPAPHWQQENFSDIASSHFCILYAEPGDHLVITIGEIFYAMAYGKPIYVIGYKNQEDHVEYHPDFADWTTGHRVRRVASLRQAIEEIKARVAREGTKS